MAPPDPDRPDLEVPVAPIAAGRGGGSSRAPILGAMALVAVVVAAIALAQAFPAISPTVPIAPTAASTASRSASPAATAPPVALPAIPRVRTAALVEGVVDGSLDGFVVYADALLRVQCPPEKTACAVPELAVAGLGLEVIPGDLVIRGIDADEDRGLLVLGVRGRRLEYLGSLVANPAGPPLVSDLPRQPIGDSGTTTRGALLDVAGWLVVHPACETPAGRSGACRETPPFLAEEPPLPGTPLQSEHGEEVLLAGEPWAFDPAPATVTEGPFVVAPVPGDGPRWLVIARYDPARSVRVVIP